MKPRRSSRTLLAATRSKAKMIEFGVPPEHHIDIRQDPARLCRLAIGILGDLTAETSRGVRPKELDELRQRLSFSARFFDSYLQSRLNQELDSYLILLGSASYYLCGFPGSSRVLASWIGGQCPDLQAGGLEHLLFWLLRGEPSLPVEVTQEPFARHVRLISDCLSRFYENGTGEDELLSASQMLRTSVYSFGSPRELLFGDTIAAIIKVKHENALWTALPRYSGLTRDQWSDAIRKRTIMRELWPAQHLLGRHGVFNGRSAVVQMPTSAGKTKATELVLRSAFLADRVSLSVIVAPFRALCHEIRDSLGEAFAGEDIGVAELSDALQSDYEVDSLLETRHVLVVTPEKLVYVIRHVPELASRIGLIVFDEAHQFDSGTRGVTYELLLTSLRTMLPANAQKLLMSAVIANADAIGEWMFGSNGETVSGTHLTPTFKSVGFASWLDQLGRIEYVSGEDPETEEFFVPRVIQASELQMKPRERRGRRFPDRSDRKSIALFLGLKLVGNGSIAIFCGRKSTASSLLSMAVDVFGRGFALPSPAQFSDSQETRKLHRLHLENLGSEDDATKSALQGIFSHHGNTPHGIRLAVEYAMREGFIQFVICTSTLAQGVNLPIRYLIVTNVYQGASQIKVRDFHNLIGRVGRAGIHTEGSVLFADPDIYDKRRVWGQSWRWQQVKQLLEPSNAEPCASSLLSLLDPIVSNDGRQELPVPPLEFLRDYLIDPSEPDRIPEEDRQQYSQDIERRQSILSCIESFLLSHWEAEEGEGDDVAVLAEETLAFFLAEKDKKPHIRELFGLIAKNVANKTDPSRRKAYGATLYGVRDAQKIDDWVQCNIEALCAQESDEGLLDLIWTLLATQLSNTTAKKCDKPTALKEMTLQWIRGRPFHDLLGTLRSRNAKMVWGKKKREFKTDHIVDICENGLGFEGAMLIGALIEFVQFTDHREDGRLIRRLSTFQKKLKYGLPDEPTICLYEIGFADRVIAQKLSALVDGTDRLAIVDQLRKQRLRVQHVLDEFPSYYTAEVYGGLE